MLLQLSLISSLLLIQVFGGVIDFFDPNDPATESILKYIQDFDRDNDQIFEKEEYKDFFFLVLKSELISIGFTVEDRHVRDLQKCTADFVEDSARDIIPYSEFMNDFTTTFLEYLGEDDDRCPVCRTFWEPYLKKKGPKRRKRRNLNDL